MWKFELDGVPKPLNKSFALWDEFAEWLMCQIVEIIVDFEPHIKTKRKISETR